MRSGKPDGYWRTYYPDGKLKSEGNRKFFQLDSVWVFYNERGDTSQIINYKNGKKNGYIITYDWQYDNSIKKGGIISKELYVDDIKQGLSLYYKNGKLIKEVYYKDGKKNGLSKEYDDNGNLIAIIEYKNDFIINREFINRTDEKGLKQGVWKTFYPNNKIKSEIVYRNDTIIGVYKEFDINGKLVVKKYFENGKEVEKNILDSIPEIEWKEEFYETGRRKYYGAFRNGIKVGLHKEYDPEHISIIGKEFNDDGVLIAEGIVDTLDRKQSEWKYYYEDGSLKAKGKYSNNLKTGEWEFYYPNGRIEQKGSFKRNKPSGKWIWYYPDGKIKREENYIDGKEEGISIEYDENGNILSKGNYLDGEKTGYWTYNSGDVIEEGKYVEGLKDSTWKIVNTNNKLVELSNYIQGQLNGKYKLYYPNGKIRIEGYYIMGKREKKWYYYDENGIVFLTITYRNDKEYKINGEKIKLPKGSFE
jgi:antitoxin component YwqK of YwqJK toxin-antitoxin module